MANETLAIGKRRWFVELATRLDVADPNGPGLIPTYINAVWVWAAIEPIGLMTYYQGIQTDVPITHKIIIRWRANVNLFDCIVRNAVGPDGDSIQEIYMIKRSSDWQGRKRFLQIEARLEERTDLIAYP